MKTEYAPWLCFYAGMAGFFFMWQNAAPVDAAYAQNAVVGITWLRIVTFVYVAYAMEMSWYQPRTTLFCTARSAAEIAILIALWQFDKPTEFFASILALVLYESSRLRIQHPY